MRIIIHVDMDYFFAQIEERENPELKGKPVVVGADPKGGRGRGVVSTCNYEARKYGIHSGMPISIAWRKCPNAVFLPVNMALYEKVSNEIMTLLKSFADSFEQVSIDEAYLDVSKRAKNFDEAKKLGEELKKAVWEKHRLTCSVGIGPNKLIAKIAAGMQKPNGMTVVRPEEVREFLNPLPVDALYGIGPKTKARLNWMGVRTVEELSKVPKKELVEEFGVFGQTMYEMARGIDESPVVESYEIKSIGRQHTFERDTRNERLMMTVLDSMIREVYRELKSQNLLFRTVTLVLRYEDFETHTKSKTVDKPTDNVKIIREIIKENLKPFLEDPRAVRLVGVRVQNLVKKEK